VRDGIGVEYLFASEELREGLTPESRKVSPGRIGVRPHVHRVECAGARFQMLCSLAEFSTLTRNSRLDQRCDCPDLGTRTRP
jgi:hypothetical protein